MSKKKIIIGVIFTFLIDQATKTIVQNVLELNKSIKVINNFFYLTLCHNTGISFSFLSNQRIIITILSILALAIIIYFIKSFKANMRNQVAFILIIGGLLGNLFDRIIYGYVRDFLDFYIFSYDYPVFNAADIFIVIGVLLLIVAIIKGEDKSEVSL